MTSCEVEFSTYELFTNECIIIKISAEVDDVFRKPARAVEISTTNVLNLITNSIFLICYSDSIVYLKTRKEFLSTDKSIQVKIILQVLFCQVV